MSEQKNKTITPLVKQAIRGEPGAVGKLCAEKTRSILYICTSLTGNIQDGEDVSQEVFIHLMKDIGKLKNAASFHSWLYRIIQREYVNMVRKQSREREFNMEQLAQPIEKHGQGFRPEEYLEDTERRHALEEMLSSLPPKFKLCVLMFYYEGMRYAEIAKVLNISKKDVDNTLHRSRQLMKKTLEQQEDSDNLLCHFPAMVSVPVLGSFMRQQAAGISQISINAVLEGALASAPLPAGVAVGGVATMVKMAAVTAAVAVGATGAYSAVNNQRNMPMVASESIVSAQASQPLIETPITVSILPMIETLEDMLGTENLALLNAMAVASPVNEADFERFLANTDIGHKQEAWVKNENIYYDLYCLDKQDKRLMLLTLRGMDGVRHGLTYLFTTTSDEMPHSAELLHRYTDWRA